MEWKGIFRTGGKLGGELGKLHLIEAEVLEDEKRQPAFNVVGENAVEKGYPKYVCHSEKAGKGRVYINKDQYPSAVLRTGFEGVRAEVWDFHIGGYQVCEKWLKDRRGRELSYDDIRYYQRIVVALGETGRLIKSRCLVEMFD